MKKAILFVALIAMLQVVWSQNNEVMINGKVTDGSYPLSNVNIKNIDSSIGTKTDDFGNYSFKAQVGDLIEYSFLGYAPIQIIIEDVTEVLNLKMTTVARKLEEVIVKKRVKKTYLEKLDEYESNSDLIKTAYGFLDKRKSATSLNIIDERDFLPGALNFVDAIQGKFNGRITYPSGNRFVGVEIYLRERPNLMGGPQPALYDIDGSITDAGSTALAIPASEIKRIAILRGLSASSRYGNRAIGGVIIINTKTGRIKPPSDGKEVKDLQAAQAEFTNEELCQPSSKIPQPNQLKNLMLAESVKSAKELYKQEKEFFENSPYVLIDAGNYFRTRWNDKVTAKEIWDEVKVKFSDNSNILKVIAYYFEQDGYLIDALAIYQKISSLRLEYAQSYRDLANMHNQLKNPKQALNIYGLYLKSRNENSTVASSEGIDFVVNVEASEVLSKNRKNISKEFQNLDPAFKNAPTRILLEWNNGETEFDIAMIRKDKSSLIWKHSYLENPTQITEEKKLGYASKQFFMDREDVGKWLCTMRYLGNKSPNPSYLKVTLQYRFGTSTQKNTIKVIRLPEQEDCLMLFTI